MSTGFLKVRGIVNRFLIFGLQVFVGRCQSLLVACGQFLRRRCRVCERPFQGDSNICTLCVAQFHPAEDLCGVCAEPLPAAYADCRHCAEQKPAFDSVTAGWLWAPPLDRLIKQFKFDGDRALGLDLAHHFAGNIATKVHAEGCVPDVLLPMPLHVNRLKTRGFNQSYLLAKALGKALGVSVRSDVDRVRNTPAQSGLKRAQRLRNLRAAFRVVGDVEGLSVGIVDDVMTTGSSAQVLSQTLLDAGAASVHVYVVAKVV